MRSQTWDHHSRNIWKKNKKWRHNYGMRAFHSCFSPEKHFVTLQGTGLTVITKNSSERKKGILYSLKKRTPSPPNPPAGGTTPTPLQTFHSCFYRGSTSFSPRQQKHPHSLPPPFSSFPLFSSLSPVPHSS